MVRSSIDGGMAGMAAKAAMENDGVTAAKASIGGNA